MKKYIQAVYIAIEALCMINIMLQWALHPSLTQMQLLIEYWPWFLIAVIASVFFMVFSTRDINKR